MQLKRNDLIDIYRLIFAVFVTLVHYQAVYKCDGFFARGAIGVEFFFVLSGFLMANSARRENKYDIGNATYVYIEKRVSRICVPYFICWVTSFIAWNIQKQSDIFLWSRTFICGIPELLLLHLPSDNMTYFMKQTWFISVLLIVSFITYPILIKYEDIYVRIISPTIAVIIIGYICKAHGYLLWDVDSLMGSFTKGFLRCVSEINIGIFLYGIVSQNNKRRLSTFGKAIYISISSFSMFTVIWWIIIPRQGNEMDFSMIFLISIAIFMLFTLSQNGIFSIESDICSYAGRLSLSLYLSHRIVLDFIMPYIYIKALNNIVIYLAVVFIVSTLVDYVSILVSRRSRNFPFGIYEE